MNCGSRPTSGLITVGDVCISMITKSELLYGSKFLLGDSMTKRR